MKSQTNVYHVQKDMPLRHIVQLEYIWNVYPINNDLFWCKSPNLAENRVKLSKKTLRGIKGASELSTTDKKDTWILTIINPLEFNSAIQM